MTIGIIPNISKENIGGSILQFIGHLKNNGIESVILEDIIRIKDNLPAELLETPMSDINKLCKQCDIIASIGGDGTMLRTAYMVKEYDIPIMGINFGKLGFLAEFDLKILDTLIAELKAGEYSIEERIVLAGNVRDMDGNYLCDEGLYAINDIVIDKGGWTKMIELSLKVDDDYVTTFSADGLILATPTGSTGYSLSTGGPIVSPESDVISLSPIAPHSLTMRPLVLSSNRLIAVKAKSPFNIVQVNCDGQRVYRFTPPVEVIIYKSSRKVKLIRTKSINYFTILREKLFWGLDARKYQKY